MRNRKGLRVSKGELAGRCHGQQQRRLSKQRDYGEKYQMLQKDQIRQRWRQKLYLSTFGFDYNWWLFSEVIRMIGVKEQDCIRYLHINVNEKCRNKSLHAWHSSQKYKQADTNIFWRVILRTCKLSVLPGLQGFICGSDRTMKELSIQTTLFGALKSMCIESALALCYIHWESTIGNILCLFQDY